MLGLTALDIVIVVLYFMIVAAIGIIATRSIRNREDYLMGGRRFGKVLLTLFQFGSGTHADNAVGVAAQSYKVGFAGIWYQCVMLFTLPVYWLLAPIFRRARVLTTADFFERRFGTTFMLVYSFFALFVCVGYTSVMLFGSAMLVEALTGGAIPYAWGIVLMAGVSFFYGIAGGLIAAVWNDFFQGILTIVMSLLIIPFFWVKIGGLSGFQAALGNPHEKFQMVLQSDMTLYWIVMMSINSLFSAVAQPQLMSGLGSSRTEMDSRVGYVGGMLLKRIMTVPWALTGVMAIALYASAPLEKGDLAFGAMARDLLPMGFTGLMLACVMASMMDNCAVNMLSFAGIYTNSIHKRLISPDLNEKQLVLVTRLASVVFAAVSIGLSYVHGDVPGAMRFMWKTVPLMGIAFFMAVIWRRTNRYGALASFFVAFAAMLFGEYVFGWKGDKGLPKTITLYLSTGIFAGIAVSLLTGRESKRMLDRFFLLLSIPVGREDVLHKAGLVEIPGTGTFDISQEELRREEMPGSETSLLDLAKEAQVEMAASRRQAILGFVLVLVAMLAILGATKLMAMWLGGDL
jgi:Na+/proline symporter